MGRISYSSCRLHLSRHIGRGLQKSGRGDEKRPEAIDDYVGVDNPVRFIDVFVDGLDLAKVGFARAEPKATGRPGYAPGDLLKLYIYGYLNRTRSSRRLEAECRSHLAAAGSGDLRFRLQPSDFWLSICPRDSHRI